MGNTNKLARQRIVPRELLASAFSRGMQFTGYGNWCGGTTINQLRGSIDRDHSAPEIFVGTHPGTLSHPFRSIRQVKSFYGRSRYL